jgi:hypothetical protein
MRAELTRGAAARRLVQLLATDIVGDLLDVVADPEVRDLALKTLHRCRGIATDEDAARALTPGRAA